METQYNPFSPEVLAQVRGRQRLKEQRAIERNGQKPPPGLRPSERKGQDVMHVWPVGLVQDLCLRGHHAHFCVVRYLDTRRSEQSGKFDLVTVSEVPGKDSEPLTESEKSRALSDLESWGWIRVVRNKGKLPWAILKWRGR
jgi:hypothetical protein